MRTNNRGALPTPRYIKWESVCIGDTLRVEWDHDDIRRSATGTIAERQVWSQGVELLTPKGKSLLTIYRDHSTEPHNVRITLLDRAAPEHSTLEGINI